MLKILLKALVLFLIVLSVYLIVHPSACSNMLAGRRRTDLDDGYVADWRHPMAEPSSQIGDGSADHPIISDELFEFNETKEKPAAETKAEPAATYSQKDIDYAIASRYVELEQEYARKQTVGKDTAREISFIVMDDFEMSQAEWESFLSRATATGLFEKVRKEMAKAGAAAKSAEAAPAK